MTRDSWRIRSKAVPFGSSNIQNEESAFSNGLRAKCKTILCERFSNGAGATDASKWKGSADTEAASVAATVRLTRTRSGLCRACSVEATLFSCPKKWAGPMILRSIMQNTLLKGVMRIISNGKDRQRTLMFKLRCNGSGDQFFY